jgi:hypothetical protein
MPTYVALVTYTDRGMQAVRNSPKRLDAAKALLQEIGSAMRQVLMAMGIAPTWRGPLPTMTGKPPSAFAAVARTVDLSVVGPNPRGRRMPQGLLWPCAAHRATPHLLRLGRATPLAARGRERVG